VDVTGSELLGFAADARVLLLNCDDLGMNPGINTAVVEAVEDGVAASCSLMVPCPAAADAMELLRAHPRIPFGIHLTLVCDTPDQPWGPVAADVPSLLDPTGALSGPGQVADLLARARLDEVEREFRAQIGIVLDAGLEPTHLDWHCLADGGRPDIFDLTVALAAEHGLAARVWLDEHRERLGGRGLPVVDHPFLDSFGLDLDGKAEHYAGLLRDLPAGLTEWAVHPGLGDAASRAVDPGWRVRQGDHEFLTSPRAREIIRAEGIVVTDYRAVQRAWAAGPSLSHFATRPGDASH
jgi:chitin disaccharide deacetylase